MPLSSDSTTIVADATVTESQGPYGVMVNDAASDALDTQHANVVEYSWLALLLLRFGHIADTCSNSAEDRPEFMATTCLAA